MNGSRPETTRASRSETFRTGCWKNKGEAIRAGSILTYFKAAAADFIENAPHIFQNRTLDIKSRFTWFDDYDIYDVDGNEVDVQHC